LFNFVCLLSQSKFLHDFKKEKSSGLLVQIGMKYDFFRFQYKKKTLSLA